MLLYDSKTKFDDPRNTHWSNDQSRFGFKMLQKMGWSEGKGLGKNEDGRIKHVSVSVKRDNKGIGADDSEKQLAQAAAKPLNDLLQKLNKQYEANTKTLTNVESSTSISDDDNTNKKKRRRRLAPLQHRLEKSKLKRDFGAEDRVAIFGKSVIQNIPRDIIQDVDNIDNDKEEQIVKKIIKKRKKESVVEKKKGKKKQKTKSKKKKKKDDNADKKKKKKKKKKNNNNNNNDDNNDIQSNTHNTR